jgi:hypothetical protein
MWRRGLGIIVARRTAHHHWPNCSSTVPVEMEAAMVRAKFKVTRYETQMNTKAVRDAQGNHLKTPEGAFRYEPAEMRTIILHPVYDNTPGSENATFWDATPSGELRLGTVNPAAWQAFELDREYYLDITPVK